MKLPSAPAAFLALASLVPLLAASPAGAAEEALYNLSGNVSGSVIGSGTTVGNPFNAGFTFEVKPYYTVTVKSIAIWVNQAALTDSSPYRTTIKLVDVADPAVDLISANILKSECATLTSQGFCSRLLDPSPAALVPGKTYRLTASYSTSNVSQLQNDNLYFISNLPSNQVSYASAISFGQPYYSGTCSGTVCSPNGLFGPNLNVETSYNPPPPEPTPAPLPLLGASSAFAFSRRLRRHMKAQAGAISIRQEGLE